MSARNVIHLLLSFVLVSIMFNAPAQSTKWSYSQYVRYADSLYKVKDYEGSLKYYSQAFAVKSNVPGDLYNGACSAALAGADRFAMELLKLAVDNGYTNIKHLKLDEDLKSLHELTGWSELVDDLQGNVDHIESKYDKPLQQELLAIYESDQSVRHGFMSIASDPNQKAKADSMRKIMHRTDSINLIKVTKIIDKHGWVGRDVVGPQASEALFLVIQHADLKTQEKYVSLLRDAVSHKVARADNLALMEDRIAIGQGRKQIYGSQVEFDNKTGKARLLPLEDPKNVNVRRASMGLEPIEDYLEHFSIQWDPATAK